ncbi:UNVERIFIED_CONTAM: hypothetical protein FKN15_008380 [Acipenser sinensis]
MLCQTPRSQTGTPAPARRPPALNVLAVILRQQFLGGKQLPRAFPSVLSLPIIWNGNSSSSLGEEKQRKMRKTVKTVPCVGYFPRSVLERKNGIEVCDRRAFVPSGAGHDCVTGSTSSFEISYSGFGSLGGSLKATTRFGIQC